MSSLILGVSVVAFVDEAPKSGYALRQERYREYNKNKKSRDIDRRQKRENKRIQAYYGVKAFIAQSG